MNRVCPICEQEVFAEGDPVPLEENAAIGTLYFCSDECRDQYEETGSDRMSMEAAQESVEAHQETTGHDLLDMVLINDFPKIIAVSCHQCGQVIAHIDERATNTEPDQ